MGKYYTFDNEVTLDLSKIESIGRSINNDPYSKTYGPIYEITMVSGAKHEAYEYINYDPRMGMNTYGRIVMAKAALLEMLRGLK
jgi:hypothetical protein